MKYEDLGSESMKMMLDNAISWDKTKNVYLTKLHKNFYLKEVELSSETVLSEFCELIRYLEDHPEYGVSTDWASSDLNRYVYINSKKDLKNRFPATIEALSRFYYDSSIIAFYKTQGAKAPTIIDLIGTTGAGKTTFCQQFVDTASQELLKLTITDSAESTVMQTDILILEKTEKKMFLRARSKIDIMKDIMNVALELDLNTAGNTIKDIIKKNTGVLERDVVEKVNNFFSTDILFDEFTKFANKVQGIYKGNDRLKWIQDNALKEEYIYILDDQVGNLETAYYYGYLQEYDLESNAELQIISTIANTEFNHRKKDLEEHPEMVDKVSYRLLFDRAILIFPCSLEAKEKLEYDFQQGIVFRDSQGHKLEEQNGIASDFEVKNKIFLIPIDSSGYLIDERYSNIFERIIISEPKNNIFILTKIDVNTTYKKYKKSDYKENKKFVRDFSDKIAKTHNNILSNFKIRQSNIDERENQSSFDTNETSLFEKFMTSFNNAYLSEIDEDILATEGHKINYSGKAMEEFDTSKLNIEYLESWFDIIGNIIKENRLTYHDNISRIVNWNYKKQSEIVKDSTKTVRILIEYYISQQKWQEDIEEQFKVFTEDFRTVYRKGDVWYYSNFITDGNTSTATSYFKDLTGTLVRNINSYVIKDTTLNYLRKELQDPLTNYLLTIYSSKNGDSKSVLSSLSNKIIMNSLERAAKIAYKVFDRQINNNYFLSNVRKVYEGSTEQYIQPQKITLSEVLNTSRSYSTYTEHYAGVYCHLIAKHKFNLETYFLKIFQTVLESELQDLNDKVK